MSKDISGSLPILRLGGNTQDKAAYCEDCPESMNSTYRPGSTEAIDISFSKGLFKAMNENMPSKQEYIFGLNLGRSILSFCPLKLSTTNSTRRHRSRQSRTRGSLEISRSIKGCCL